ncbi:GIY-YIG nuclease family protein [Pseudomonas kurunegalensis]|uniref:GIY-YIG nuclease family protein n=1 Tax=Pseudomonas kurunegalensis TaxID=485880 RepID=UPI0025702F73|nr:GIY-YIG nuclease family protein [Pseudomonas kurunegalensis]WJD65143.1 GIY-YIG nuclease family protein [Pseudomonas kurunegalensis]
MIGRTRRLEPMDRVDELGDESVPFWLDVHAMVFSFNAPALEAKLHEHFTVGRINKGITGVHWIASR